jgi:hypothetical protein
VKAALQLMVSPTIPSTPPKPLDSAGKDIQR